MKKNFMIISINALDVFEKSTYTQKQKIIRKAEVK